MVLLQAHLQVISLLLTMSGQASSSSDLQTAQPKLALPNGTAQAQSQLRELPMTALPANPMPSVDMSKDDSALPHGTAIPQSPKSSPPSKTRRQESPIQLQPKSWPMPPNISALQLSVSTHALEATNTDPSLEQGGARPHGPARQLDGSLNQIRTALPEGHLVQLFSASQIWEDEQLFVHQQEIAGIALALDHRNPTPVLLR